jgi:hypothetical protein
MLVPGISQVLSGQSYVRVSAHTDIIEPFLRKIRRAKDEQIGIKRAN